MNPKHLKLLKKAQALDRSGKSAEASVAYKEFLKHEPKHSEAWSSYAGKLLRLGSLEEAQQACETALVLDPQQLSAQINLGRILMLCGRLEDSEDLLRQAMATEPHRTDAQLFLAECLLYQRELGKALKVLEGANRQDPMKGGSAALRAHHAELWVILSKGLFEAHDIGRAESACHSALQIAPDNIKAKMNLGSLRMVQGHLEEADGMFRRILHDHPRDVDTRLLMIACLARQGRLHLSDQEIAGILQQEPDNIAVHQCVAATYYSFGRWPEFRVEMDRFRRVDPSSPLPDFEQSFVDLLFGDMPQGWERHEARLKTSDKSGPTQRAFTQPAWDGAPFPGKTLLLWAEQGLGDTLMFLRYLPMVKALGGQVIVEAQPPLMDVAATCQGVDAVIPRGAPWHPFDLQLSLLSLPWIFSTDLSSIPAEIPYLDVPAQVPHRQAIQEYLAMALDHTRIGLVWGGNPTHGRDSERSIPVRSLAPLGTIPGVSWFSLQVDRQEVPPLPSMVSLAPVLKDFSDTAFALSGLDLLITVDTSVAHLAGAMGIPTLLLLTFQPDFRWLLDRDDSPWYPTLRLYRQPAYGDWASVIRQVVTDLTQES